MKKDELIYELKEIQKTTDIEAWVIGLVAYADGRNPINEASDKVVMMQTLNILHSEGGYAGWEIIDVKPEYTKNHPKCDRAGQFFLKITIWLRRPVARVVELEK